MSWLSTIGAFVFAILLLVGLHELGHLLVARWCGIKVLRFSIGMGKPFYIKKWRNIDWCIAPIPLGGYVKMVDTREGEVAEADLPFAFDRQPPLKRMAVVIAGPLTNLILAILLYTFSFGMGGVTELKPLVGEVLEASVASRAGFQAGDRILSVNGKTIRHFHDAQLQMVLDLETGKIVVEVQTAQGEKAKRIIDVAGTEMAQKIAKRQASLGLSPYKETAQIGQVQKNSPADKAGLQAGDTIIAIDGIATATHAQWSKIIRENAGRNLQLQYLRHGEKHSTTVLPDSIELPDKSGIIGRIGVMRGTDQAWAQHITEHQKISWQQALGLAWEKTYHYTSVTFQFFGKLILGEASLAHISSPITIADMAGQTARMGWQPYVDFLAVISISLGAMNLLPIPLLDGGHLLYYTIELIRGKALSQHIQDLGSQLGITLLMAMMILAFFNDITRLFG